VDIFRGCKISVQVLSVIRVSDKCGIILIAQSLYITQHYLFSLAALSILPSYLHCFLSFFFFLPSFLPSFLYIFMFYYVAGGFSFLLSLICSIKAFCRSMGISLSRLGKFSSMILLRTLSGPWDYTPFCFYYS